MMTREQIAEITKAAAAGDMVARNTMADLLLEQGRARPDRLAMAAAMAGFLRLPAGEPDATPPSSPTFFQGGEWPGFTVCLLRETWKAGEPRTVWLLAPGLRASVSVSAVDQLRAWAMTLPTQTKRHALSIIDLI